MSVVAEIEIFLLESNGWVPTPVICSKFAIPARLLRQDKDRPGLLDHFAVSSTKNGQNGYCHHKHLPTADWLPIKHRLRRHAIGELAMNQIVQGVTVAEPKTGPSTEHLATINKLLKSPGRRPKKAAVTAPTQMGLFSK